jgi:hypothetical protein
MAVQDYFANFTQSIDSAVKQTGVPGQHFQNTFSILAADDDNSTYTIMKNVPATAVIHRMDIETPGLANSTDWNIGLADSDTGAVLDDNAFADALDFSSAATKVAPLDGLKALTGTNSRKPLYELLGLTLNSCKGHYDIIATGIAVGTAAGDITVRGVLIPNG